MSGGLPHDAQKTDFTTVRFSTDDLSERERIPVWREVFGRSVFRTEIEPAADVPFHAEVTVQSVPGLDVVSSAMSPVRLVRTPQLVADGNDDVAFFVSSSGGAVAQCQREITFGAGDAVVSTAAETAICVAPSPARYRCFHIRRAALAPLVANLDDASVLRQIPPDDEALRYLLSYVGFLQDNQLLTGPALAHLAAVHVLDLFALMLGATDDAAAVAEDRGLRAARLTAIKADIANHLDQPDFSVSTLAARHGITPRYIQLLFESEGTTFSQFVLGQRLARVHRLLSNPRFAHHAISALALEAGFGDISYFNRAFRRHYGATPSEVRDAALRQQDGGSLSPGKFKNAGEA